MTNEQYLTYSYFLVGLLSAALGLAAFLWLRRPFREIASAIPASRLAVMLRKLFPVGMILPAVAGFLSVSYYEGCTSRTYESIVADRAYLVAKNQEQISTTLSSVVVAVLVWGLAVLAILAVTRSLPPEENPPTK